MKARYEIVKLNNGEEIAVYKVNNDVNGNPRFVVHYLSLGLDKYISISKETGLQKYKAKWFGGGYVFSTYRDLGDKLSEVIELLR